VRVLLDTSVLVAAMIEAHPHHERALPWLQRIKARTDSGVVAAHSIAEVYAILTRLPLQPRISPRLAQQLIKQNILDVCEIIALTEGEYHTLVDHLAGENIQGGATYDALILHVAAKAAVDQIVTFNVDDFRRVYPSLTAKVVEP
jgi:predicted nucleic acid-binding protein